MATIEARNGKYRVRWNEGGRDGRWRSRTLPTLTAARALKTEVETAVARAGTWETPRPRARADLDTVFAGFITDCSRRLAPRTVIRYGQHLDQFVRWLRADSKRRLEATELTRTNLSDFHAWVMAPETGRHVHRRGTETARKMVQCVEQAWDWAWRNDDAWPGEIPTPRSLQLKAEPPPQRRAPSWEQMDACIAACGGWHRQLAIVMRFTGLRVNQALHIRWEDLRLDATPPVLHVRPELGKNRRERRGRWVPIAAGLAEQLRTWEREGDFVVACAREQREARARDFDRAWTRAGVDRAVWEGRAHHAFRAGFESGLKRLGADTEAVEYLVGHSRGIREHYVGPDALPLVDTVARIPTLQCPATKSHCQSPR